MKHICCTCRKKYEETEMVYGPDPFAEEIYGDETPMWLCDDCHEQSRLDI